MPIQQCFRLGCFLLLVIISEGVEGWKCPFGFIGHGRSCYWFSHQKASYIDASRLCHHFKSHLVTITSKAENDFIRNFAIRHGKAFTYWLGASDLRQEGTWTWEDPVRKIGFANWAPGQPDNAGGVENCLEIRQPFGNYLWNDFQCQIPGNFICETSMK